jgi:hypothetical protein
VHHHASRHVRVPRDQGAHHRHSRVVGALHAEQQLELRVILLEVAEQAALELVVGAAQRLQHGDRRRR